MSQLNDFKKELKELLSKYSATISMQMSGDTHGIYNEHLTVAFLQPLKDGDNFRHYTDEYHLTDGMNLSLKEIL